MKRPSPAKHKVLVVDVGGTHVKCAASGRGKRVEFASGPDMTPVRMMKRLRGLTAGWRFDAVSIGYPGVVANGRIVREPHNLGRGWIDFDFSAAFGCPVRIINDAAMQALGAYAGGKMLFLGLGTGLGSALIVDGVVAALELGHLRCGSRRTYEDEVGDAARRRLGNRKWRRKVDAVVADFRDALLPDSIVIGGGNVAHLRDLPPLARLGGNADAIEGGVRMWDAAPARRPVPAAG